MQLFGDINQEGLALMGGIQSADGETPSLGARVFDSDGDGRNDLVLVDSNNDGKAEGVVRGIDADGDGRNDTFVQYNEDGSVASVGRVNPMTGQFEVVYEEPDLIDKILDFLGLSDLDPPEQELFTTFDDPYLMDTFGTFGSEVSDISFESVVVESSDIIEVSEEEYGEIENGIAMVDDDQTAFDQASADAGGDEMAAGETAPVEETTPATEEGTASATETTPDTSSSEPTAVETEEKFAPTIVGIEDRSGGDGSSLWAKVDMDGDMLADTDAQISKGGAGEYYADINEDGYSETVANDMDMDGRIDTVDTTGKGSSTAQVDAGQVVDPSSDHMVDKHPGEDDATAAAREEAGSGSTEGSWEVTDVDAPDTDASYDAGDTADDGGVDAGGYGGESSDSGATDSGSSYDASSSSSYDAGSSTSSDDSGSST
jgi:hypothetical protein